MSERALNSSSPLPPLKPGLMRIYSMRFCPFAQKTRLVLIHKNIPFETVNIDLSDKPKWFLERNPGGAVPVLEKDGKVVYESLVTAAYLDDAYPENPLTPTDAFQKAQDKLLIELFGKVIPLYYRFCGEGYGKEDEEKYLQALDKVEDKFKERLAKTRFLSGNSVQMVDFMIWPHAERFETLTKIVPGTAVTAKRFPNINKWMEAMSGVPAVKKIRWDTPTHVKFLKSFIEKKPNYDLGL